MKNPKYIAVKKLSDDSSDITNENPKVLHNRVREEKQVKTPKYFTVKQFPKAHPAFTIGGLRHRIFHSEENGLERSGAIIRDGRKVLIREDRFFNWLENKEVL